MANSTIDSSDSISDRQFIQNLKQAIADLLWLSEAEYPFEIVYWQGSLDKASLLQHYDYPPQTPVQTKEFLSFFASAAMEKEWYNETELAEVKRYRELVSLMQDNLNDLQVYLVGEVEIDAYILGKTQHQAIAGLKTKIIAT